jgi:hypothetical protein
MMHQIPLFLVKHDTSLPYAAPSNVLTIAGAEAAIAAAVARGAELNFTALNIVVVDR